MRGEGEGEEHEEGEGESEGELLDATAADVNHPLAPPQLAWRLGLHSVCTWTQDNLVHRAVTLVSVHTPTSLTHIHTSSPSSFIPLLYLSISFLLYSICHSHPRTHTLPHPVSTSALACASPFAHSKPPLASEALCICSRYPSAGQRPETRPRPRPTHRTPFAL
jgi:hypothetical protein